ncbi:MAG: hypothetical protein AAF085_08170 [Planctomycetota bacterium]
MPEGPPGDIDGRIQFFAQRLTVWADDPAAIGLTPQQMTELQGRTAATIAARDAALALRSQAASATAVQNEQLSGLMKFGSGLIASIRAFADLSAEPAAVFNRADLTPPAQGGGQLPPPVAATDVKTQLGSTGAITVSWKGTVANGTVYAVYRRFAQGTAYSQIGTATTKSFVDATVPVGTPEVSYYVVALRDGLESPPSEPVSLRFGSQLQPGGETQLGLAA